jgi:hypothetical protein
MEGRAVLPNLQPEADLLGTSIYDLALIRRTAKRAFKNMICDAKANDPWLIHRVQTGLGPFDR